MRTGLGFIKENTYFLTGTPNYFLYRVNMCSDTHNGNEDSTEQMESIRAKLLQMHIGSQPSALAFAL